MKRLIQCVIIALLAAGLLSLGACTLETAGQREQRLAAEASAAEASAAQLSQPVTDNSSTRAEPVVRESTASAGQTNTQSAKAATTPQTTSPAGTQSKTTRTSVSSDATRETAAQTTKSGSFTCFVSITCTTAAEYAGKLSHAKRVAIGDGVMLARCGFSVKEGESVFDLLVRAADKVDYYGGKSARYIKGINQLYEKDCGAASGWVFYVNGRYITLSCSMVKLKPGDVVEWKYTCDNGKDL